MGGSSCGMIVGLMMAMMMVMMIRVGAAAGSAAAAPAPAVDCETVAFSLSDCLGYVTGTEKKPSAKCCSELKTVINTTPQCLCLLYNTTFTAPLGVNITIAQQLPPACKLQTPPPSLCSLFGVPVASPVAAVPATSPVAPSPTPASTAPMTAPSPGPEGSLPSTAPSPMNTVPSTGSMAPPGAPTTSSNSTASPNSAPTVVSGNAAAVAAFLLLLATIFLS